MKKILKKDGMYGSYMNTDMAKNYLHNMADSFPVPSYLVGKSEDELKNQLKSLAQRVSLNGRRLSTNDSSDSIAGPEEDPFGGVQHLSAEPEAHEPQAGHVDAEPKARHADAEPVNHEPVAEPIDAKPATRQLIAQDLGARLALYKLMVKGLDAHNWSIRDYMPKILVKGLVIQSRGMTNLLPK